MLMYYAFTALYVKFRLSPVDCLQDLIGENAATEFARSREHIRVLVDVLTRVHDIAERLVSAANVYANDMNQLSKELR